MSRGALAALLYLFVRSQVYAQEGEPFSSVLQVTAWNTVGQRIDKIWVVASSLDGRKKYTGNGRDVKFSVPTGEYVLQVEAPGFQSKRQLLNAYQPAVFRSAALPVARLHGQTESGLTGTLQNYTGNLRDLRIRLMGLYGNELWEAVPDQHGSFSFPADEGAYLLLVVADFKEQIGIIDSQPIRISLGEQQVVTVDLKGKEGTVLPLAPR